MSGELPEDTTARLETRCRVKIHGRRFIWNSLEKFGDLITVDRRRSWVMQFFL
jgi:hypothetical protein